METKTIFLNISIEGIDEIKEKIENLQKTIAEAQSLIKEITSATILVSL